MRLEPSSEASISASSQNVARIYGVSPKTVRDIWKGRTWNHATNHRADTPEAEYIPSPPARKHQFPNSPQSAPGQIAQCAHLNPMNAPFSGVFETGSLPHHPFVCGEPGTVQFGSNQPIQQPPLERRRPGRPKGSKDVRPRKRKQPMEQATKPRPNDSARPPSKADVKCSPSDATADAGAPAQHATPRGNDGPSDAKRRADAHHAAPAADPFSAAQAEPGR
eukprot:CAMPEP_0113704574 /NCGR_PEP_ID=MMETSP0038_2-20120614/26599_1 /TAXON_ID=2898 /ORGANISM="Cryptomonas paramecium" /LENGTH=220 /DNA_ID=CAMNT_0000629379 /DNA_START=337 /DNA_END=996 /DNA_ORIENTATION=- /assembly_acc=CAM_ASM_000170